MKVDIEQVATCVRRLTIEIPTDRVDRELRTIYKGLQKRVKIPGFRPGKVPQSVLESYYGQSVEQEVLQKLVPEALSEALVKESVQSVGEPQIDNIDLVKDQPLRFVATTQIIPDFDVTDYHDWHFERRIAPVMESQTDEALERVRASHAELQAVTERAAQEHDFVILSYAGHLDGQPLAGAVATNVSIEIGTGQILSEIERGLIGMLQGEEKTIPVPFPADYRDATVAGKEVHFHITVSEIKEKILSNLDDEFAQAYEEVDSLAALRERVRTEVEAEHYRQADAVLRRDILDKLVDVHPIDVPDVLLHEQMRRMYLQQRHLETGGALTEADLQVDPASLGEEVAEKAREVVRGQLILRHISQAEEITITPKEIDAEVASLAARTAQNPEALKLAMERNGALNSLENALLEKKIFAAILAKVQVADIVVSAEALNT